MAPENTSTNRSWVAAWLGGGALFLVCAAALTFAAGRFGYKPRLIDDKDTWMIQRDRVSDDPQQLVILGMSRLLLGFSVKVARQELPGWDVIQLATMGYEAGPTLRDLAENTSFRGVVLYEIGDRGLDCEGMDVGFGQQMMVWYRQNGWRLERKLNRQIKTALQQRFVVLSPRLNPLWQAYSLRTTGGLINPDFFEVTADREHRADWTQPSAAQIIGEREASVAPERRAEVYEMLAEWMKELEGNFQVCEPHVERIMERGGKVIYVRPPTYRLGGIGHDIDERFIKPLFQRVKTRALIVHALDVPELRDLPTPDGEHLDRRDTPRFTRSLIGLLREKGVFSR